MKQLASCCECGEVQVGKQVVVIISWVGGGPDHDQQRTQD